MIRIILIALIAITIFLVFKFGKNARTAKKIIVIVLFIFAYSIVFYVTKYVDRDADNYTPAQYINGELVPSKVE